MACHQQVAAPINTSFVRSCDRTKDHRLPGYREAHTGMQLYMLINAVLASCTWVGKLYNTFNDAMAAACSAPDAVGMWESDKGVHYVLRKGDVRKWGPGVPNSSVRRVWRLIQDSGEAKDKGDGRSPADAPSAPQADEVLPEPTSTLETPQVPAPAVSTPPFAAHLISGSGATHNQVKIVSRRNLLSKSCGTESS